MSRVIDIAEKQGARAESVGYVDFYSDALKASEEFRAE